VAAAPLACLVLAGALLALRVARHVARARDDGGGGGGGGDDAAACAVRDAAAAAAATGGDAGEGGRAAAERAAHGALRMIAPWAVIEPYATALVFVLPQAGGGPRRGGLRKKFGRA